MGQRLTVLYWESQLDAQKVISFVNLFVPLWKVLRNYSFLVSELNNSERCEMSCRVYLIHFKRKHILRHNFFSTPCDYVFREEK